MHLDKDRHRQGTVSGVWVRFGAREEQVDYHPGASTSRGSHPAVVRLCWTNRYESRSSGCECITAEEIELASLVSAPTKPGEIVSFDPQPRSSTDHRALLKRCRRGGERRSLEVLKHGIHARDRSR